MHLQSRATKRQPATVWRPPASGRLGGSASLPMTLCRPCDAAVQLSLVCWGLCLPGLWGLLRRRQRPLHLEVFVTQVTGLLGALPPCPCRVTPGESLDEGPHTNRGDLCHNLLANTGTFLGSGDRFWAPAATSHPCPRRASPPTDGAPIRTSYRATLRQRTSRPALSGLPLIRRSLRLQAPAFLAPSTDWTCA